MTHIGNLYPTELVWLIQSIPIQSMQPAVLSRLLRLNVDCNKAVAVTETVASFPDGHNVRLVFWIPVSTVHITMCQAYGGECLFAEWPWHLQQVHKNMQQSLQRCSSVATAECRFYLLLLLNWHIMYKLGSSQPADRRRYTPQSGRQSWAMSVQLVCRYLGGDVHSISKVIERGGPSPFCRPFSRLGSAAAEP